MNDGLPDCSPTRTFALASEDCSPPYSCSGRGRTQCDHCSQQTCGPGLYLKGCQRSSAGECTVCPRQTYAGDAGYRDACTPCGFLDACDVGQVLVDCGPVTRGSCVTCDADSYSTSRGTMVDLQFDECTKCSSLTCSSGFYRVGCGTTYSSFGPSRAETSSGGFCFPCPIGMYTPKGTPYDSCRLCPANECPGEVGKVYLEGCVGEERGVCRDLTCTLVDARTICTVHVQAKVASGLKISGGQGVTDLNPSNSDAFGSAVTWLSSSSEGFRHSILAIGAARDITGASANGNYENMPWRVREIQGLG